MVGVNLAIPLITRLSKVLNVILVVVVLIVTLIVALVIALVVALVMMLFVTIVIISSSGGDAISGSAIRFVLARIEAAAHPDLSDGSLSCGPVDEGLACRCAVPWGNEVESLEFHEGCADEREQARGEDDPADAGDDRRHRDDDGRA